jgi:16S rRNA (adenine1518-N6/adenine1519-N6)-dimethyltransferase
MSAIDDLRRFARSFASMPCRLANRSARISCWTSTSPPRIARAAGPLEDATIIEIGPGPGGLTRALLALGARRVIAVERDQRALPALEEISRRYRGRLEIICADAQHFDPRPLLGGGLAKIVANLPYNIATALLIDWLSIEPWPPWYDMMVLMFQREVAERIVARENDEAYGRLGVLANWRAETKILFDISPAAFVPQPKVTSSLVRPGAAHRAGKACDRRALEQVAAAAFGQRRKMLRQSLKSLAADPARLAAPRMSIRRGVPKLFRSVALLPWPVNCPIYETQN